MSLKTRQPTLKQAFSWMGSKYMLAPKIIELMPAHKIYIEVFGGSGAVLLRKEASPIEVLNDINEEVINFFEVLRNQPFSLIYKLWMTPYSREIFRKLCKMVSPEDPLERAWRFFVLANMSYSGSFASGKSNPGSWGRCFQSSKHGPKTINAFTAKVDQLYHLADRLKHVYLESLDFEELVKKWDKPGTLFYCDPPYIGYGMQYKETFGEAEHKRLAEVLNSCKGKVILSYYPDPLLNKLYKGWKRIRMTRQVPSSFKKKTGTRKRAKELLLLNFRS